MIEVELKFPVDSLAAIGQLITTMGAVAESRSIQSDEYLNDPLRDFAKQDLALRIRSCDGQYCLTFKGPKLDPNAKIRKEIEMPLTDPSAAAQMKSVFEELGFFSVAKVIKQRETLSLQWQGEKVLICLDDVTDVGQFVELELIVDDLVGMEQAKQKLFSLAEKIGLREPIQTSYLHLLLKNRGLL